MNLENYQKILDKLNEKQVSLVAVSKTKPINDIKILYNAGQRIFGENKVQELVEKQVELPADIEWHMIGHLQRNKVKYIAPFVSLIHGVDSLKLLKEINKRGLQNNRVIKVLLQVYIAKEKEKFGLIENELIELLESETYKAMENIRICGLMGMATNTEDNNQISIEFAGLKKLFDKLKENYFADSSEFKEISMGMSGDYGLAIEQGSTMVRIGSLIFGHRNYTTA